MGMGSPRIHHRAALVVSLTALVAADLDMSTNCAAAFRLTMKGYQPIAGADPETVCSRPPASCARPTGVFHLYVKMCAGLVVGKNLLNPLFTTSNITWIEATSLAHAPTASALAAARRRRWPTITVLRHPIDRILAHFFATHAAGDFAEWKAKALLKRRRGYDGSTRYWMELENVYTKIFAAHDDRSGTALAPADVDAADATLAGFDRVVVAEWLEAPQTAAWLGDLLCFEHARGVLSNVPSLARTRRGRGGKFEAFRRDSYASPDFYRELRPHLADLAARNALDLDL